MGKMTCARRAGEVVVVVSPKCLHGLFTSLSSLCDTAVSPPRLELFIDISRDALVYSTYCHL